MDTNFNLYRERFIDLYEGLKKLHLSAVRQNMGHGLDHDITVAKITSLIAPDYRTAEKSWCAALLHSVDRLIQYSEKELFRKEVNNLTKLLPNGYFKSSETDEIVEAVVRHAELNDDNQSITQRVLMDADRLANLMPSTVIRAAQYRPNILAFEFKYLCGEMNPDSTYKNPCSVLDSLRKNISEYVPQLRLPVAKKMAEIYVKQLNDYINSVEKTYKDLDLTDLNF